MEANEDYLGGRGRARRGGPLGAPKNDLNAKKTLENKQIWPKMGAFLAPTKTTSEAAAGPLSPH